MTGTGGAIVGATNSLAINGNKEELNIVRLTNEQLEQQEEDQVRWLEDQEVLLFGCVLQLFVSLVPPSTSLVIVEPARFCH